MRILGLDISTSTVGIAIIDFNKSGKAKLIHIDYYKPIKNAFKDNLNNKDKDLLNMLSEAKKTLMGYAEKYKPDVIAVEDYIKFMKGGSGAGTIIPLATLNRTICLAAYETYPLTPLRICNVMSIRTRIKKDVGRQDLPPKEEIPVLLENLLNISIPRPIKHTKKGDKILEEHWDMADAVAVAYYSYRQMQESK